MPTLRHVADMLPGHSWIAPDARAVLKTTIRGNTMDIVRSFATAALGLAAFAAGGSVAAQHWGDGQRFRCESNDGRTNYCNVDTRGGVVLVRQLSRGPCIEGQTWGWDRRGVWVAQGCRAEFETGVGQGGPGWGGDPGWGGNPGWGGGRRVVCESRNQRVNYCDIDTRGGVSLVRQLSRGECTEGRSWGWDRRGVWVSNGCRGEFVSGRGHGGGWQGGPGHGGPGWGGDPGWNGGHGGGQVIRCESREGRTQYCNIGFARDVRLQRQLSRGACIEGRSWGWDRRGLWVSNGCRGEFAIW